MGIFRNGDDRVKFDTITHGYHDVAFDIVTCIRRHANVCRDIAACLQGIGACGLGICGIHTECGYGGAETEKNTVHNGLLNFEWSLAFPDCQRQVLTCFLFISCTDWPFGEFFAI